jgi:hypothetical protein
VAVIPITTTIPPEWHAKIKANHWRIPEIIGLGIKAREGNPQMIARIKELEDKNLRLRETLDRYVKRVNQLELDFNPK